MSNRPLHLAIVATTIGALLSLIIAEGTCQLYALYLAKQWQAMKQDPLHYYVVSRDPVLGYELKANLDIVRQDRVLRTNRYGWREEADNFGTNGECVIGILGDSVVFGTGVTQSQTLDAVLESRLQLYRPTQVVNLGVPGYALPEIKRHLELQLQIGHFDTILFVLNLNDFAKRNSVYEGADNGLYRAYHMPTLKLPWFIRKFIYRAVKGKEFSSERWYRWLFEGTADEYLPMLIQMNQYANSRGVRFGIAVMPGRAGYSSDGYRLRDVHKLISKYLESNSIAELDITELFGADPTRLIDLTEHLTVEGVAVLAKEFENTLTRGSLRHACSTTGDR